MSTLHPDCDTIDLLLAKDLDRIYLWGLGEEHLLCYWAKGQSLRMQSRSGTVAARTLLGTE